MRLDALRSGVLLGLGVTWMVASPGFFLTGLYERLEPEDLPFLVPAFFLLVLPGAWAGFVAAEWAPDRRQAWRFAAGLFVGASAAASALVLIPSIGLDLSRQVPLVLFGGAFLAGFWIWLGAFLGLAVGYERRERAEGRKRSPPPVHG